MGVPVENAVNPDKNKQAIQVIFSQKRDRSAHPLLYFNRSEVVLKHEQKHLGMILDSELNFHNHAKEKVVSARKATGVVRFMSKYVTREVLDQMHKLYVRPHLDYGDIIYHKYDPHILQRNLRLLSTLLGLLSVAPGVEQTGTNRIRNLVGSIYTTEGGTEG